MASLHSATPWPHSPTVFTFFSSCRDYIKALNAYRQRVWSCKYTGESGLTYEEAAASESHVADVVSRFPAASEEAAAKPQENAEVAALKKEVEELKTKNTELSDRMLRALADAENVRRISRIDVGNAREFAISKFAKSLLDVADNLKRAHESIVIEELHPDHTLAAIKTLHEGVVMTEQQMQKVFREFKIDPVGTVGDKFDPNVHDALFHYVT